MSKNLRHFIFYFLTIFIVISSINNGLAQNRYWVNGTGNWNDTNHWAESSGGKPGASIPSKENHVIFDNNSFTAINQYVLIKDAVECSNFDWNVNKYTPTFKSKSFLFKSNTKASINIYGSLNINENLKNEFYGDIILKSTDTRAIILKSNIKSNIIIDAVEGEYILKSDINIDGNLNLKSGTLRTQDYNINLNEFIGSGSEIRALYLGNSEIAINTWDFQTDNNLSFNAGNSQLLFKKGYLKEAFKPGNLEYNLFSKPGAKSAFSYSINETDVTCNGAEDGMIEAIITSGGTSPFTYVLYEKISGVYSFLESSGAIASTSYTFNPVKYSPGLPGGVYLVDITDKDGTTGGGPVVVVEPEILNVDSIGINAGLSCWNGSDAELEAYASGGNEPYSYQWIKYNFGTTGWDILTTDDPANKILTGASQGWYKALVTGALGCDGVKETEMFFLEGYGYDAFIPDSIDITGVSSTNTCSGFSTGSITISATGGTTPLTYAIVRASDSDSTIDASGVFTGLQADTYRVYAIDDNDCFKRHTNVIISSLTNPTASILPPARPADACPGIPLALDGNPTFYGGATVFSHSWTGTDADSLDNKTIQAPNFTSIVVGSYDVIYTVTDNNGCVGSDNLTIVVDDLINPTITCIAPPTKNVDPGQCYYTVSGTEFDPVTVNDNCGVQSVINDFNGTSTLAGEQIPDGTIITWTVTDFNSNTAQCNYTVTVVDNEDPTITCIAPPTRNVDAGQCYYTVVGVEFDPLATGDNCGILSVLNDFNGTGTLAGEQIANGTVITWTITDNSLNTTQCNYTVTVVDNEDPTISCIAPPTRNNDTGQCYYTVVGVEFDPLATGDNCGIASVVNNINGTATLAGEQILDGTVVTWTITDNSLNTAQCNYTVTVNDIENPTIACIAPPTRNVDPGQCYYTVVGTEFDPVTTTDNCGFTVTNDFNGISTLAGEQIIDGTIITWTITDNDANTAQCNYTVTVVDNEDPTITCIAPPSRDPDAGQCYYTVVGTEFDPVTTTDNCGVATITNDFNGTGTLAGEQIFTGTIITWTVTDNSLNTTQCNYTVTVVDNEDPTITCIAPPTRNVDAGQCYYTVVGVEFDPLATGDNCGILSVLNDFNGTGTLAGEQITDGTLITWTITDNSLNTTQCNYTVTVVDNEDPTITCIAPPTRNVDAGQCYYTAVGTEFDPVTTTDNCGIASVLNDFNGASTLAGAQIPDGTVITWTVTDNSLNTAQCNFTVTVIDNENPSITCIAPPTRNADAGQCYYTVVGTEFDPVTTTDNCGVATITNDFNGTGTLAGEQIFTGTIITWTVTDNSLNTAQCNYTVTVVDNEDPTITCIAPPTRNVDAGQCYYTVVGVEFDPLATGDNCGILSVLNDFNGTGTLAGEQITDGTLITWTITDNSLNTTQCNYTVTVVDNEDPTITCIAPPTRNVDAGQCYYTAVGTEFDPVTTTDNCGIASVLNDFNGASTLAGAQIPDGTVITWTVTDNSLNTAQCNFTVTVIDNENPSITCIAPPTRNADAGQCYYTVVGTEFDPVTTTDNCGVATITNDFNGTGTLAGEQIFTGTIITWTVTDNSLNTAQCNYTVTVVDNEDPTITCIAPPTRNVDAGQCYYTVVGVEFDPLATGDNCGILSVLNDFNGTGTLAGEQITDGTLITWTITDNSLNTTQCNYTVTVVDNEDPTITCIAPPTRNVDAGQCYYTAVGTEFDPVTTTDNCGIASVLNDFNGASTLAGAEIPDGTVITWTVTDNSLNTAQCNFTVTVIDNENPSITCIAPPTRNADAGQCYYTVVGTEFDPVSASDNCGFTITNDFNGTSTLAGEQIIDGSIITWTITDNSFNTAQCNYTVSIIDAENPTIICPADAVVLQDGSCTAVVNGLAPTTGDNCGVTVQTWTMAGETINAGVGDVSGETFKIGVTTVTYHIEDAAGNFIECSFDVEVYDEVYGGLIDVDQTICYNTTPNPFTDEDPAIVCGGRTYQWQKKSGVGPWGDIPGAIDSVYTELNPLTEVTYYNRKAISNLTFGTAYSDTITITIQPEPIAFAGKDTTVCYGSPYQIMDADTTNSDAVSWEILTGNGNIILADITKIDPVYTPDASDGGTTVELVLHASGKATCGEATDTIRITYPAELLVSIGKPTPFYIDSASTHINVYFKIESHRFIGDLALYLVSPLDSVVELKTYCVGLPLPVTNLTAQFYNDPQDTSTVYIGTIDACNPLSGNYKFLGDWKKKLHGQDPANGAWRVRIGDNRNISGSDGFLREATVTFSDTNTVGIFESILLADSSINIPINESPGGGVVVNTERVLPITGLATSCFNTCDATAVSTASGGIGSYAYAWNTSLDFTTPLFVDDTVYLCPGKYYVQATDSLGCTAIDSVTVGSPPEIVITNRTFVHNTCNGDSIGEVTLEFTGGAGGLTYTHDKNTGPAKLSGETFDVLKADEYIFTISDGYCSIDTAIIITEPTAMTITVDTTNISCYGIPDGEIDITVSGGTPLPLYEFSIDSALSWHANPFINLDQDTFYVAVRDGAGCIQFADTIKMLYPDTITIDAITVVPTTCSGGGVDGQIIISASGGASTLQYSLDGITYQTSNIFTGLSICDTTVFVKDRCGFKELDTLVSVTGPIPPVINSIIVTDVSCFGENTGQLTVNVSGGTGNYEYYINGVVNTPPDDNIFTDLFAGIYTISVIDDGGCSSADSIREITEPSALIITGIDVTHVSACNTPANTGEIIINATGGTLDYQYSVTGYPLQISNTFSNLDIGDYTVTVRDFKGCERTLDTSVVLKPAMTISLIKTDISCYGGTNGSISVNISNGTPIYDYKWSTGDITSSISNLTADVYTVTVTDNNSPDPCQDIASIEILEPSALSITPDIRPKRCIFSSSRDLSKSLGRIIIDANGGTPDYTYKWTGPSIDSSNDDNDTVKNLQPGPYYVTITDSKGCNTTYSTTLLEDDDFDILDFDVQMDDNSVCWNDSVRFTSTYAGNVDSIFMQVLDLETYTASNWVYQVFNKNPFRGRYKIEGESDFERIRATNQYCKADTTHIVIDYFHDFELDIIDELDGNADDDTIYMKGARTGTLNANVIDPTNINFDWYESGVYLDDQPNVQILSITPDSSAYYAVIATSTDECVDTSSIYLEFIPAINPNDGFSPNGDGINDYWKIKFIDKFQNNIVTVYSRWGVKVYEQKGYRNDDTSKSWDGKAKNGKDLPSGTYYYVIILNEAGFQPITGPITIIR